MVTNTYIFHNFSEYTIIYPWPHSLLTIYSRDWLKLTKHNIRLANYEYYMILSLSLVLKKIKIVAIINAGFAPKLIIIVFKQCV